MLTDAELVNVRRFAGYPVYGTSPSGNMGWQYFQAAGLLEYRMANLSAAEETALRQMLAQLVDLENAIPGTGLTLDTSGAGEWTRNPVEVAERTRLFDGWRRRLCGFLGVPPGSGLSGGNAITCIV